MKRRLILIVILIIIISGTTIVNAQTVSPIGLGVRLTPDGGGFTGKFFLDPDWAIEAQVNASGGHGSINYDGPSMTVGGLLEYHISLDPSWRVFFGPGIHFGTWDRYNDGYTYFDNNTYQGTQGILGIDAVGGIEYLFRYVPIGVSADVKPAIDFARDFAFFPNNFFGVSARYYVGRTMTHKRGSVQGASHS